MRSYKDMIGAGGPGFGWGGGAQAVFGAQNGNNGGGQVVVAPGGYPGGGMGWPGGGMGWPGGPGGELGGYPWDPTACYGPPPVFDASIRPFSGALGAACGPLLVQTYLPFEDVGCIKDCEEVEICAFPQYWSKIVRIILCDNEASSFIVTGGTVGIDPIFVGPGVLPGCAFSQNAEGVLLNSLTAFPNQRVCIRVRNVSGADAFLHPAAIVMASKGSFGHLYGQPLGSGCA